MLANDTDPDGDTLTIVSASASAGSVSIASGTLRYTPMPDANGTVLLTYEVSDGALVDQADVTVSITPVNDAPVANDDTDSVGNEDGIITIDVRSNDTDVDGDRITVDDVTQPARGFARPSDNALFVEYDAQGEVGGTVTFTYTIVDGNGGRATATITVTLPPAPT